MNLQYLTLFFSFPEDTQLLTDAQRGRLVVAMIQYAKTGEQPQLEGNEKFLWPVHKGQIDRYREQLESVSAAHRAAGALGGRPRKADGSSENQNNQMVFEETEETKRLNQKPKKASISKSISNTKSNSNTKSISNPQSNTNTNYQTEGDKSPCDPPVPSKRFVKPSVQEVRQYIQSKGYTFSADAFVAFYESNGWKVGRNPMKDWKQACVTWQTRSGMKNAPPQKTVNAQHYEQRTGDLTGAFCQFTPEEIAEMMKDDY